MLRKSLSLEILRMEIQIVHLSLLESGFRHLVDVYARCARFLRRVHFAYSFILQCEVSGCSLGLLLLVGFEDGLEQFLLVGVLVGSQDVG